MRQTDRKQSAVVAELSAIADRTRGDLVERWEAAYGRLPPKGISRRLLEYSAAYAIQVGAFGGLKPSMRRRLERVDGKKDAAARPTRSTTSSSMTLGARLIREWHGRTYTVDVIDGGFRYDGRDYKSLSQIARDITGVRWSGPRFFGL